MTDRNSFLFLSNKAKLTDHVDKSWYNVNRQDFLFLIRKDFYIWKISAKNLVISKPEFIFRPEEIMISHILYASLSLDGVFLAVQNSVNSLTVMHVFSDKKWNIKIKYFEENRILMSGIVWGDHGGNSQDLVIITSNGVELYKVSASRGKCSLSHSIQQTVLSFLYEPNHRALLLISRKVDEVDDYEDEEGLHIDTFFLQYQVSDMPKLQLPPPDRVAQFIVDNRVCVEDISVASLYNNLYCITRHPDIGGDLISFYRIDRREGGRVMKLYELPMKFFSRFNVSVFDNLLYLHCTDGGCSVVVDINVQSQFISVDDSLKSFSRESETGSSGRRLLNIPLTFYCVVEIGLENHENGILVEGNSSDNLTTVTKSTEQSSSSLHDQDVYKNRTTTTSTSTTTTAKRASAKDLYSRKLQFLSSSNWVWDSTHSELYQLKISWPLFIESCSDNVAMLSLLLRRGQANRAPRPVPVFLEENTDIIVSQIFKVMRRGLTVSLSGISSKTVVHKTGINKNSSSSSSSLEDLSVPRLEIASTDSEICDHSILYDKNQQQPIHLQLQQQQHPSDHELLLLTLLAPYRFYSACLSQYHQRQERENTPTSSHPANMRMTSALSRVTAQFTSANFFSGLSGLYSDEGKEGVGEVSLMTSSSSSSILNDSSSSFSTSKLGDVSTLPLPLEPESMPIPNQIITPATTTISHTCLTAHSITLLGVTCTLRRRTPFTSLTPSDTTNEQVKKMIESLTSTTLVHHLPRRDSIGRLVMSQAEILRNILLPIVWEECTSTNNLDNIVDLLLLLIDIIRAPLILDSDEEFIAREWVSNICPMISIADDLCILLVKVLSGSYVNLALLIQLLQLSYFTDSMDLALTLFELADTLDCEVQQQQEAEAVTEATTNPTQNDNGMSTTIIITDAAAAIISTITPTTTPTTTNSTSTHDLKYLVNCLQSSGLDMLVRLRAYSMAVRYLLSHDRIHDAITLCIRSQYASTIATTTTTTTTTTGATIIASADWSNLSGIDFFHTAVRILARQCHPSSSSSSNNNSSSSSSSSSNRSITSSPSTVYDNVELMYIICKFIRDWDPTLLLVNKSTGRSMLASQALFPDSLFTPRHSNMFREMLGFRDSI